jgi:hypothetical protein
MRIGPTATRDILADMGVNPTLASVATPMLYWSPAESNSESQMVMVIIQGVQKGLKRLGFPVRTNGRLDAGTQNAIAEVVGRNWASAPWIYIYGKIKEAHEADYGPKPQVNWRQDYSTAVGEALGADNPTEPALYGSSLNASKIICTGAGSSEYCYSTDLAVSAAFRALQLAVGVSPDGKIGSKTAAATVNKLNDVWLSRFSLGVEPEDADLMAKIINSYNGGKRPYSIAAYANRIAEMLTKYKAAIKAPSASGPSTPIRLPETVITMPLEPTASGFSGSGLLPIGLAALAGWFMFKGGKKGRRRAPARRRRRSTRRRRR